MNINHHNLIHRTLRAVIVSMLILTGAVVSASSTEAAKLDFSIYDTSQGKYYGKGNLTTDGTGNTIIELEFDIHGWCTFDNDTTEFLSTKVEGGEMSITLFEINSANCTQEGIEFQMVFFVVTPSTQDSPTAYGYIMGMKDGAGYGGPFTVGRKQ